MLKRKEAKIPRVEQLKLLLAAYAGTTFVLLLLTIGDLSVNNYLFKQNEVMTIDAWFGLWILLQIGTPVPGILLLVSRSWRELSSAQRTQMAFGFFLIAWLLLLAFDLRFSELVPYFLHIVTFIFGVCLLLGYLISRRQQPKAEDMFP